MKRPPTKRAARTDSPGSRIPRHRHPLLVRRRLPGETEEISTTSAMARRKRKLAARRLRSNRSRASANPPDPVPRIEGRAFCRIRRDRALSPTRGAKSAGDRRADPDAVDGRLRLGRSKPAPEIAASPPRDACQLKQSISSSGHRGQRRDDLYCIPPNSPPPDVTRTSPTVSRGSGRGWCAR